MTYWIVTLGLVGFGVVALASIGRPFVIVGLALVLLRPMRNRPMLFGPPLAAVVAWNIGFLAIAPFYCSATQTVGVGAASTDDAMTVCSSLIGITYSGRGIFNPSLEPANQAALLLAALVFVFVLAGVHWQGSHGRVEPPTD